jgi:hypothetical protein
MFRYICQRLLSISLISVVLPGCSGGTTVVRGKLVMDGTPYQLAANEQVLLSFETIAGPERSFAGLVKADGSFTVVGIDGNGVPPGRYRITIRSLQYGAGAEPDSGDKFEGLFSDRDSPLTCEVKRGAPVTIDLAQKTVTGG